MGKKMSEMTIEELREFVLAKIEKDKEHVAEISELKARIKQMEKQIAEMVEQINGGEAIEVMPDKRVTWAENAVKEIIAEIHTINRTSDNSLIGLNSAEVDFHNKIIEIRNECPKPGLVKGCANKFLVEPLEAELGRIQKQIESETLKVMNG